VGLFGWAAHTNDAQSAFGSPADQSEVRREGGREGGKEDVLHATALSLPFLDKEGEWGFLDGLPIRMTLSPLLARRPINLRY